MKGVYGCKNCYLKSKPKKQDEIIEKFKQIYGEDRFDFSKFVYKDAKTKVTLICNICGSEFEVLPADILRAKGVKEPCRNCLKKSLCKTLETFEKEILNKFGNKFDLSKVVYKNAKTPIILICNDCGTEFEITPDSILNSEFGCPTCALKARADKRRKTTEQFIEEARKVHGDKYDYSITEYFGCNTPVEIICKKHGVFKQLPSDHLSGHNCPKCKTSIGELFIEKCLEDMNIDYTSQYWIKHPDFKRGIFVDFSINYNDKLYLIEYNGIQHYKPIEYFGGEDKFYNYQIPRDNALKQHCSENNIPLLIIKYNLKNEEVEKLIKNFLIENGIRFSE